MPVAKANQKVWSVLELLNWTSEYLAEKGFENGRLNGERMLAHVLNCKRVDLYLNFDRPLSPEELAKFKELIKRRHSHEPLQYILGETEFFSLPVKVRPGVLIPRPETETMVEQTLALCKSHYAESESIDILDIGTGSGNIAVAIAKNIDKARLVAIDVTQEALDAAQENAKLNHVEDRISFRRLDVLACEEKEFEASFDLIVSNPPYISSSEFERLPLEIRQFEPRSALLAREDGFEFYRHFALVMREWLKPGGFAILEIGAGMGEMTKALFHQAGYGDVKITQDLAGRDRVITIRNSYVFGSSKST